MPSTTWERIKEDVRVVFDRDPAARSTVEILLTYPGVHALFFYRVAHWLWRRDRGVLAATKRPERDPKPCAGLTHKPECPACEQDVGGHPLAAVPNVPHPI